MSIQTSMFTCLEARGDSDNEMIPLREEQELDTDEVEVQMLCKQMFSQFSPT